MNKYFDKGEPRLERDRSKNTDGCYIEIIRLLPFEFEVQTNSPDVFDLLALVNPRAEQIFEIRQRYSASVILDDDEFYTTCPAFADEFELNATSAVDTLYRNIRRCAISEMIEHAALKAVVGGYAGHHFLIVGPNGSGKSTLALSLLMDDFDINGDELAFFHDGSAIAFPRRFLAREESLYLLPKLRAFEWLCNSLDNPQHDRVAPLDPSMFGKLWKIAYAAISKIFYLEPNHGAQTKVLPCSKIEMARRALPCCASCRLCTIDNCGAINSPGRGGDLRD